MIRDLIRNLNPNSYCLILDIDAFPLSKYAIKLTFVLAMLKGINGNIQRTNCIDNGDHLFIGPSYICFNTKTIQNLKESAWIANDRSDVSEEITWVKPDLIDQNLFRPINTLFKPIWALEGRKKLWGRNYIWIQKFTNKLSPFLFKKLYCKTTFFLNKFYKIFKNKIEY